jgi:hypothetical protein
LAAGNIAGHHLQSLESFYNGSAGNLKIPSLGLLKISVALAIPQRISAQGGYFLHHSSKKWGITRHKTIFEMGLAISGDFGQVIRIIKINVLCPFISHLLPK